MKRDIEKYIREASEYLNKHTRIDMSMKEYQKIYDMAHRLGWEADIFNFISYSFMFGFSVGRKHGKRGA